MTFDLAQMIADREAGTPGEWGMKTVRTQCGVCHQIGPWPHKWRAGTDMSACIYDDYPSPPVGTDTMLANARRIASVPLFEAEILRLTARVAELEGALGGCVAAIEHADMSDGVCCCGDNMEGHSDPMNCGHSPTDMGEYHASQVLSVARAALSTPTEEPKT